MLRIVLVYPRKMPVRASERIAAERWAFGGELKRDIRRHGEDGGQGDCRSTVRPGSFGVTVNGDVVQAHEVVKIIGPETRGETGTAEDGPHGGCEGLMRSFAWSVLTRRHGGSGLEMIARFREQVTDGGVAAAFATEIHADVFTSKFMSETMKTKPTVDEV
jgi:hypothetical protein